MFFKNLVSYILATEYIPERHKTAVTTFILCGNAMVLPITAFYFRFIGKDWTYLYYYFYLVISTFLTLSTHFAYESPRFLYEKEQYYEARMIIDKMAKINSNATLIPGTWLFDKEHGEHFDNIDHEKVNYSEIGQSHDNSYTLPEKKNSAKSSVRSSIHDLPVAIKESPFKIMRADPVVFVNLMIIMSAWISTSFNTYLLSFSLRNLGGNIYFNAWAFGFAGMLGKFLITAMRKYTTTKVCLATMLIIAIAAGI